MRRQGRSRSAAGSTSAFSLVANRSGAPKKRSCSRESRGARCAKRTSAGLHLVRVATRPVRTHAARSNSAVWRGAAIPPGRRCDKRRDPLMSRAGPVRSRGSNVGSDRHARMRLQVSGSRPSHKSGRRTSRGRHVPQRANRDCHRQWPAPRRREDRRMRSSAQSRRDRAAYCCRCRVCGETGSDRSPTS